MEIELINLDIKVEIKFQYFTKSYQFSFIFLPPYISSSSSSSSY